MRVFILVILFPFFASSQGFDIGIGIGGAMYNGDLTVASSDYLINHTHVAISLNGAYHIKDMLALRAGIMATNLSANDAVGSDEWQLERNLNFKTSIYELSLQAELNLLSFVGKPTTKSFPFVYAGASAFKFNPKAQYKGLLIPLQPLGTEGQGIPGYESKYNLVSMAVLIGVGYTYNLPNGISINTSFGWRRSNTDYIDDISTNYVSNEELYNSNGQMASELGNKVGKTTGSQRGGQDSNDWFNVGLISINYNFGLNGRRLGSRHSRLDCPSSF